jgi:hypothetical protein
VEAAFEELLADRVAGAVVVLAQRDRWQRVLDGTRRPRKR